MELLARLYSLVFLLTLLLLSSCGVETLAEYEPLILEGQAYLENYETPPFLYQYEEKNEVTGQNRGWIIDNQGNLRKYENVHIRMYDTNNAASMRTFVERTAIVRQVDVNQLVNLYKKNLTISRSKSSMVAMDEKSQRTHTYFGYTLSYPDDNGNNCSARRQPGFYVRIIFESEGQVLVRNSNLAAKMVLDYLKDVEKTQTP